MGKKYAVDPIYWSLLKNKDWKMYIAATDLGLCFVGSHNESLDELTNWVDVRFPGTSLIQDNEKLGPYVQEILEYLTGKRREFVLPMDVRGSEFQLSVWNALKEIPYGFTKSYSDIAASIQKPSAVRAVGAAIGANPILITVPCHRVIGKNGSLTGYRGGLNMKTKLLELEGFSI